MIPFTKPTDGELSLDPLPACREIRIATRQAPNAVKVVGKHDHGNCSEWGLVPNQSDGSAQEPDGFLFVEDPPATIGHNREVIGLARDHPSTVVGHRRNPKRRIVVLAFSGGFHPPYR
jgi:hypothetical protein